MDSMREPSFDCAIEARSGPAPPASGRFLDCDADPSHKYDMRCASHNLACGPDGLCVLCRRSTPQPTPPAVRAATFVGGLGILVAGTAVAYRAWGLIGLHADVGRAAGELEGGHEARPLSIASTDRTETLVQRPNDSVQSLPIVVYTTSWCPVCKRAKSWMRAQGISFEERDVETSASYGREIRAINPRGSVPTFQIDGHTLVGFDPSAVMSSIQRASARSRM